MSNYGMFGKLPEETLQQYYERLAAEREGGILGQGMLGMSPTVGSPAWEAQQQTDAIVEAVESATGGGDTPTPSGTGSEYDFGQMSSTTEDIWLSLATMDAVSPFSIFLKEIAGQMIDQRMDAIEQAQQDMGEYQDMGLLVAVDESGNISNVIAPETFAGTDELPAWDEEGTVFDPTWGDMVGDVDYSTTTPDTVVSALVNGESVPVEAIYSDGTSLTYNTPDVGIGAEEAIAAASEVIEPSGLFYDTTTTTPAETFAVGSPEAAKLAAHYGELGSAMEVAQGMMDSASGASSAGMTQDVGMLDVVSKLNPLDYGSALLTGNLLTNNTETVPVVDQTTALGELPPMITTMPTTLPAKEAKAAGSIFAQLGFNNLAADELFNKQYSDLNDNQKIMAALHPQVQAGTANSAEVAQYNTAKAALNPPKTVTTPPVTQATTGGQSSGTVGSGSGSVITSGNGSAITFGTTQKKKSEPKVDVNHAKLVEAAQARARAKKAAEKLGVSLATGGR